MYSIIVLHCYIDEISKPSQEKSSKGKREQLAFNATKASYERLIPYKSP